MNATSDEDSMGNASMVQMGTVRVTDKGEVTLEMDFQSMKFAGMTGYLYKMKKVDMDTVEYNKYNYPENMKLPMQQFWKSTQMFTIYLMTRTLSITTRIQKETGIRRNYQSRLN